MAKSKYPRVHPLLMLAWVKHWDVDAVMNWLQGNGWVSDLCVDIYDVAARDAILVMTAAGHLDYVSKQDPVGQCARPSLVVSGR